MSPRGPTTAPRSPSANSAYSRSTCGAGGPPPIPDAVAGRRPVTPPPCARPSRRPRRRRTPRRPQRGRGVDAWVGLPPRAASRCRGLHRRPRQLAAHGAAAERASGPTLPGSGHRAHRTTHGRGDPSCPPTSPAIVRGRESMTPARISRTRAGTRPTAAPPTELAAPAEFAPPSVSAASPVRRAPAGLTVAACRGRRPAPATLRARRPRSGRRRRGDGRPTAAVPAHEPCRRRRRGRRSRGRSARRPAPRG